MPFSSYLTSNNIVTLNSGLEVTQVTMPVSLAISEIFSVKEWRDLGNQVRGRSRSFKMAPFDRSYATFYWSPVGHCKYSCTYVLDCNRGTNKPSDDDDDDH